MELLVLLLLALLAWLVIGPIVAIVKMGDLRRRVEDLERRLSEGKRDEPWRARMAVSEVQPDSAGAPKPVAPPVMVKAEVAPLDASPVTSAMLPALPPPMPPEPEPVLHAAAKPEASPPPLPVHRVREKPAPEPLTRSSEGGFSLEQFVGVKLFAWIGGLALFFGIVFFVKYAFERDLVPPSVRVTVGYLTAAALMAAGYWFRQRQAYTVLTQTLSATGILAFYGVTYAAHAWYHFPLFTTAFTFVLMALITAGAFITAVRAKAEVVAVLGLAGGFLTPALVSSGEDQPVILFSYVALLNLGLAALAWREKWWRLLPLGAAGTVLMSWGWRLRFFAESGYANGAASWGMVAVFGGFALLFAALAVMSRGRADNELPWWAALLTAMSALLLAFDFLQVEGIATRPVLLYTLVLLASSGWLASAWWVERFWPASFAGSLAVMLHLSLWMTQWLTPALLPHALAINVVFGLLHLVYMMRLFQRGVPMEGIVPCAVALLMMTVMGVPLLLLKEVSWLLWPPFLLAGGLALMAAVLTRKTWAGLLALLVHLFFLLLWLTKLRGADSLLGFLIVLGLSALTYPAGAVLARRLLTDEEENAPQLEMLRWVQLAALTLPYLLLAGIPKLLGLPYSPLLLSATLVLSVAAVWLSQSQPWLVLSAWLGWTLVALNQNAFIGGMMLWLTLVPLMAFALLWAMRRHYTETCVPLAGVGLAMGGALWMLHEPVARGWPEWMHWTLPALFALAWVAFTRRLQQDGAGLAQRATAGGLALAFITILFPYQFDHEWLTLAWALEAAALCWLFTRLPHDGLRLAGCGLALVVFLLYLMQLRVLDYAAVPLAMPMGLWLLLSFGTGGAALLAAGGWLKPPHHVWGDWPLRALLFVFGGSLLFLLLNLQIANAFNAPGTHHLSIDFGGNFARDMSYSIAWAVFALALVIIGFWKQAAGARYAGVGLLLLTLAKLFLHDLDQVGSIYRIAAFLAVAVIALGASFLYQRAGRKPGE